MSSIDLKSLKLTELKILNKFIKICEKNNLRWYLVYGSCLGAVRHGGFIPWDDDIDVAMPRPDYVKFLESAQKDLGNNMFLQTYETDSEYIYNFAKIRDNNTTFIQTPLKNLNINHGIYIDIFPIDGVPNNIIKRKIRRFYMTCLNLGIYSHFLKGENMKLRSKLVGLVMKMIFKPDELLRKRDSIAQKYDFEKSNFIAVCVGAMREAEVFPKEYFGVGCSWEFENIKVIIPEQYDKYLTNVFGDYMTPPPKERQVTHHGTTIIDLNNPYTFYTEKE